ncbi:MAG: hypothetical protein IM568_07750 [Flavobacterium sp.]|nr:hypothetical protein [Flavobacterium sp.]
MERNNWITTILKSTNGITPVVPSNDLYSKIQQRIQLQSKVSLKTVWLVAASIAVLILLNFSVLTLKTKQKESSTTIYLELTLIKSNQIYQ